MRALKSKSIFFGIWITLREVVSSTGAAVLELEATGGAAGAEEAVSEDISDIISDTSTSFECIDRLPLIV